MEISLQCRLFFWTKNGRKLETEGNGDKFSNVSVDNPSLTIFEVNKYDAGYYQLTATNAIGSTKSDFLTLGITAEKETPKFDFILLF